MDSTKEKLKTLMAERDAMEREIAERTSRLNAPEGPGLKGNLLDKEGFPRGDIDIASARTDRNRLAVLMNDHKAIMKEIEALLHQLHQEAMDQGVVASGVQSDSGGASTRDATSVDQGELVPFAVVDSVSPESPAQAAGIEVGDQLCKFGEIVKSNEPKTMLAMLAASLKANEGKQVDTVFKRGGQLINLTLVPTKWGGPGLIGCHLLPMT